MSFEPAVRVVRERALRSRGDALARWDVATADAPELAGALRERAERLTTAGRLTLNFHPDRLLASGTSVAAGLLADGRYRSQWATGISNGSRSAVAGGDRERFERALFGFAYEAAGADVSELPVYGALDLLRDPHGGSPRFGSSYLVLADHVRARTTMCVGDSNVGADRRGATDIGTFDAAWSILTGLAEQAAAGALLERALGLDALGGILDATERAPGAPARCLDGYVEIQVHGGVELAGDVTAIVLDPSFAGTAVDRDLAAAAARDGFELRFHAGSELAASTVPADFRGPTMPDVARRVARTDGVVDARAIGDAATRAGPPGPPLVEGDPPGSTAQQLKYLWHTLLAHGHDATAPRHD